MERTTQYRRLMGASKWHWRDDCPKWPDEYFEESREDPPARDRCDFCRAKDDMEGVNGG